MMPDSDRVHMLNGENWFDRTVSAEAAGIILTSLTINRRCWTHRDCGNAVLTHLNMLRDTQCWNLPHRPCPGPHELISAVVETGQLAPESVMARWVAGAGYAVCVDFLDERQIRRWSDERKAADRRRNLERRVNRIEPLFADELIAQELETRSEYFRRKSAR